MTEHTHPEGRPRDSLAAAAKALLRLGRVRDLPVVLMLAWVGWLAIPWPSGGLAQARDGGGRQFSTDIAAGPASGTGVSDASGTPDTASGASGTPDTVSGASGASGAEGTVSGPSGGPGAVGWALAAVPERPAPLVKPERRPGSTEPDRPRRRAAAVDREAGGAARGGPGAGAVRGDSGAGAVRSGPDVEVVRGEPDAGAMTAAAGVRELIAAERARLADEVHDAAGHGFATIAMQAGVALLMLDEHPERVRESLEAIRSTSAQALGRLRSALDVMDPEPADHDLLRLVGGVRAAGLPVDVEPAEPYVPAGLEEPVYRVVREALTNVARHAGPGGTLVRLADGPREFVLEVVDRGGGSPGAAGPAGSGHPTGPAHAAGLAGPGHTTGPDRPAGSVPVAAPGDHTDPAPVRTAGSGPVAGTVRAAGGRGLAGMRARVTEVGGVFAAGPRPDGGFGVVARFPRDGVCLPVDDAGSRGDA
ncbi:histidine kinase [Streptosporangium sandarakinum]|uniref:histidine kinase n=1 Tax=Streptosporangium sandarakinum TaxID=1260955 RepID=UPI003439C221